MAPCDSNGYQGSTQQVNIIKGVSPHGLKGVSTFNNGGVFSRESIIQGCIVTHGSQVVEGVFSHMEVTMSLKVYSHTWESVMLSRVYSHTAESIMLSSTQRIIGYQTY